MAKTIDGVLIDIDETIENSTTVKNMVIARLHEDGLITNEQAKTYIEDWQILVIKKSWYKKVFSGDGWRFIFAKIASS